MSRYSKFSIVTQEYKANFVGYEICVSPARNKRGYRIECKNKIPDDIITAINLWMANNRFGEINLHDYLHATLSPYTPKDF